MSLRHAPSPRWEHWYLWRALLVALGVEAVIVVCILVGLALLVFRGPAPLALLDILVVAGLLGLDLCAAGLVVLALWLSCKR